MLLSKVSVREEPIYHLSGIVFAKELLLKQPAEVREDLLYFITLLNHADKNPEETFFINLEPSTLINHPTIVKGLLKSKPNVVVEITERYEDTLAELLSLDIDFPVCLDDVNFYTPAELISSVKPHFVKIDLLEVSSFDDLQAIVDYIRNHTTAMIIAERVPPEKFEWLDKVGINLVQSHHFRGYSL